MQPRLVVLSFGLAAGLSAGSLSPRMVQPDAVVLHEDFGKVQKPDRKIWQPRQNTQWSVVDGMLHGQPSTKEFQASRKDHQGFEPRVAIATDLKNYVIEFRFRVNSGEQHMVGAFFELGHHFARVAFKETGLEMNIGDLKNPTILDSKPEVKLEKGRWYHVLAEIRGDETFVQFEGGRTLYGKDPRIAEHAAGVGITGLRGGTIDIDDVTIWSVKDAPQPGWSEARGLKAE
jgi:hypothetical protein